MNINSSAFIAVIKNCCRDLLDSETIWLRELFGNTWLESGNVSSNLAQAARHATTLLYPSDSPLTMTKLGLYEAQATSNKFCAHSTATHEIVQSDQKLKASPLRINCFHHSAFEHKQEPCDPTIGFKLNNFYISSPHPYHTNSKGGKLDNIAPKT